VFLQNYHKEKGLVVSNQPQFINLASCNYAMKMKSEAENDARSSMLVISVN